MRSTVPAKPLPQLELVNFGGDERSVLTAKTGQNRNNTGANYLSNGRQLNDTELQGAVSALQAANTQLNDRSYLNSPDMQHRSPIDNSDYNKIKEWRARYGANLNAVKLLWLFATNQLIPEDQIYIKQSLIQHQKNQLQWLEKNTFGRVRSAKDAIIDRYLNKGLKIYERECRRSGVLPDRTSPIYAATDLLRAGLSLIPDTAGELAFDVGVGFGLGLVAKSGLRFFMNASNKLPSNLRAWDFFKSTRQTGARKLSITDHNKVDTLAENVYELIRKSQVDVESIAKNIGIPKHRIQKVKDHIFNNKHELAYGTEKFAADPLVAEAWKRMELGCYTSNDIALLKHELFESKFEGVFNTDYRTAHNAANRAGYTSGIENLTDENLQELYHGFLHRFSKN